MSELSNNEPQPGNFEMQQQFLADMQTKLSEELFKKGVVSRILRPQTTLEEGVVDLSWLKQLDAIYLPTLQKTKLPNNEKEEDALSLVAKVSRDNNSYKYTYYQLGMIDSDGFLYPYPGVNREDADEVHKAAMHLQALKEDGTLPNLNYNLLSINNPNTGMRAQPKSDL